MGKTKKIVAQKKSGEVFGSKSVEKQSEGFDTGLSSLVYIEENKDAVRTQAPVAEKVKENIPQTLTIEMMGEELKNASYKVGLFRGRRKEHSESMNKILLSIEAFDLFLDFPVVMDKTKFAGQVEAMEDRYRHIISDCLAYLESHDPSSWEGKVRKEKVQKIFDLATEELGHLQTNAESMHGEVTADGEKTWRDIVRANRSVKYVNGKDGVKISRTGGNTSVISVIEVAGKKKYFKEKEKLEGSSFRIAYDGYVESQKKLLERLDDPNDEEFSALSADKKKEMKTLSKKQLKVASSLKKFIHDNIKALVAKNPDLSAYDLFDKLMGGPDLLDEVKADYPGIESTLFYREFMATMHEFDEFEDKREQLNNELGLLMGQNPVDCDAVAAKSMEILKLSKAPRLETSMGVVKAIHKTMFASIVARYGPQIEKGNNLSSRNVATSRLARFLEIGDCVVGCEMAHVEINGKKSEGIAMEEARGTEMATILDTQVARRGKYSVKAAKQAISLQILDIICGQTDRHIGNYTAEYSIHDTDQGGAFTIDSITGIDNDMAFGLMTYDRIKSSETIGALKSIEDKDGNFVLPAMDYSMAQHVLALEPGMLRYIVGDVLNAKEMAALADRLGGVQAAIRRKMDEEEAERKDVEERRAKGETVADPKSVFSGRMRSGRLFLIPEKEK